MWFGHFLLLVFYLSYTRSTLFSNLKTSVLALLNKGLVDESNVQQSENKSQQANDEHYKAGLESEDTLRERSTTGKSSSEPSKRSKRETVVNLDDVNDVGLWRGNFRRQDGGSNDDDDDSSSRELKRWKDEFREHWLHKKFEALNSSVPTGDMVNIVAARPWDVPCGDPNQHDMPWGTCLLAVECEAEFRIYRGDFACGRTRFVCCAIKVNVYDMYQGFDVSFDDKSLSTESEERKVSQKKKKKNAADDQKKDRQKARNERKKKIEDKIKNIVKEIRKMLERQHKNATKMRKRRTKELKAFLKILKRQYRKDRIAIQNVEEHDSLKIDRDLMIKLIEIKAMNDNFFANETFREIMINGTITRQAARMLIEAYPELNGFLKFPARTRRNGGADQLPPQSLEYDIEYGYLYY